MFGQGTPRTEMKVPTKLSMRGIWPHGRALSHQLPFQKANKYLQYVLGNPSSCIQPGVSRLSPLYIGYPGRDTQGLALLSYFSSTKLIYALSLGTWINCLQLLLVRDAFGPICKGPAYEILVFLNNFIFSGKQDNCMGVRSVLPFSKVIIGKVIFWRNILWKIGSRGETSE